jgi:hypothetical protein
MTCFFCAEPLLSILERTRGVCAACHVLSRRTTKQRASEEEEASPSSQDSPGKSIDRVAAPPTPRDDQPSAQDVVPDRDSNGSNTSEETGLSR